MENLATVLTFSVITTFSFADEEVKALLPVFGEPLKAAKLPKDSTERAKVELGRSLYTKND